MGLIPYTKDEIHEQKVCEHCGSKLDSEPNFSGRCSACGQMCIGVRVDYKNEPDKPGKQVNPFNIDIVLQPGQRLADTGIFYDSKQKKFIKARKDDDKEDEGKVPNLNDEFVSEKEFKQMPDLLGKTPSMVDKSDDECHVDPVEAEDICMQLCIDN